MGRDVNEGVPVELSFSHPCNIRIGGRGRIIASPRNLSFVGFVGKAHRSESWVTSVEGRVWDRKDQSNSGLENHASGRPPTIWIDTAQLRFYLSLQLGRDSSLAFASCEPVLCFETQGKLELGSTHPVRPCPTFPVLSCCWWFALPHLTAPLFDS